MSEPILRTKLMPPRIPAGLVPRPGLLARLDDGLERRLILVSAPTGYGKSTLVRSWLAARGLPTAWVGLDAYDNDAVRFWTYAITALHALDGEIGKTALALLASAQTPSLQPILTLLINEMAAADVECVLVLEDFHCINAQEILSGLTYLIQHKPERLHLALVTRSEPDLPLGILRARDELLELGVNELTFSREEAQVLFHDVLKMGLRAEEIERLQARTEGWPAGLRLAGLAQQAKSRDQGESLAVSFSGNHRYVADYLIREVFNGQPAEVQAFLLKTCFLEKLCGSLCEAVSGLANGGLILEQLARDNLFLVRLEQNRGAAWYRYSPLFAESIQTLARQQLGETGVRAVYEKASDWYAARQKFDEAIELALSAGLHERALGLIETFLEIYGSNEMSTLGRWMGRIPDAVTFGNPDVCMAFAQIILYSSDRYSPATAARIEPYLNAAEKVWLSQGILEKEGTLLALRGLILLWQGEFQRSTECITRGLELMPEGEVMWRGISLLNLAGGDLNAGRLLSAQDKILEARALLGASQNLYAMLAATGLLSDIFFEQGDFELCQQLCEQNLIEAVGDDSMLEDRGRAHLNLAGVAYERNDLAKAESEAQEALLLGKQIANEIVQAQAAGMLGLVRTARGELSRARAEIKGWLARLEIPMAQDEARLAAGLLAARAGEDPEAWLAGAQVRTALQQEREKLIRARWLAASGQFAEASELLRPCIEEARRQGRVRSLVSGLCLSALAEQAAGNGPRVRELMLEALAVGHEKGFKRLFVDEGGRMAGLLQDLAPLLADKALNLYARTLLNLFPAAETGGKDEARLVEPLSSQEQKVLKLMAAGLSNQEIASQLVVSANTVKTHIKNIYRKLNINSREEARGMVKELRLV